MPILEEEALRLLNTGHFVVAEPGPLHSPIHSFSIRRDDTFALILETETPRDAKSTVVDRPAGTVRLNTDKVELVNIARVPATLIGVEPYSLRTVSGAPHRSELAETAQVHRLVVSPGDATTAAHTIEWLENVPASPFIWPDVLETETKTETTHNIALSEFGLTIRRSNKQTGISRCAAKITVATETIYVCALDRRESGALIKPGCIVYTGVPDDDFRKKVRTAVSFALGAYLVELGHTVYDAKWRLVSCTARSAYSLGGRASTLSAMPPAPLGARFLHELSRPELTRMINGLVGAYDDLDLGNLSWAYWHGCIGTVHIAPAQFGAAIEALQSAYCASRPETVSTTILHRAEWEPLRSSLASAISTAGISEERAQALRANLHHLNNSPQRARLKNVFDALGLQLGADEDAAWKRRNDAAHGTSIREGDELAAIRDMKLLKGLLHRMLLRMSNAADAYIDYASLGQPYRPLSEPPVNLDRLRT